jgi:hypothetical protein
MSLGQTDRKGSAVTIGTGCSTLTDRRPNIVECKLCGTRLRADSEPDVPEVDADTLLSVTRHRCVARVTTRTRSS